MNRRGFFSAIFAALAARHLPAIPIRNDFWRDTITWGSEPVYRIHVADHLRASTDTIEITLEYGKFYAINVSRDDDVTVAHAQSIDPGSGLSQSKIRLLRSRRSLS